jgi:hypothetical protein
MFRRLLGRIGGFVLVFSIGLVGLAVSVSPQPVVTQVAQRQSTPAAKQSPDVVPAEFIGDWVPAKGTCDSTVRFRAEGNRFTLINGKDSQSYGNLFMSASYFGPDYSGISKVVVPDSDTNDPPFMVFFNADEKKGVTKLDIYTEGPVSPHAALAAQQLAHKKLAQRFSPLNNNPLKKCVGSSASTTTPAGSPPPRKPPSGKTQ